MRNIKYTSLLVFAIAMILAGCNAGDGVGGSGGIAGLAKTSTTVAAPTEYTFELSGNGIMFSADIHGYAQNNYGGSQQNPTYPGVTLGVLTQTYTMTAESMIASITMNAGAGTLTIVTKKNGNIIRTDTITVVAQSISINDDNL